MYNNVMCVHVCVCVFACVCDSVSVCMGVCVCVCDSVMCCTWLDHLQAGCQCLNCQVYAAEGKLLQVQHNIEKLLDSGKLEGQMLSMMKATQAKVQEECAVYM